MPDQFTTTTTTGYGNRVVNSIKGVVIGLVLFVASFGLLFWNEGRVDLSTVAKTAIAIDSTSVSTDPSLRGHFVSVTGMVSSTDSIGDGLFLRPDTFMAAQRIVEMYAWAEHRSTQTHTNAGGSQTTQTTYTYQKDWIDDPATTGSFQYPAGHENPQKALEDNTTKAASATIGAYDFDPSSATLPPFTKMELNAQNVTLAQRAVLANDAYLFLAESATGTFENPAVGDLRISYLVLRPGFDGTIFGAVSGNKLTAYVDQAGDQFYRLFAGTREQGLATYHSEYSLLLWILRIVGFLMMWFGLAALLGPVSIVLDFVPVFGSISRSLIGVVAFITALALTIVTIVVSMIAHSIVATVITLALAVVAIFLFFVLLKKRKANAGSISTPPPAAA